MSRPLDRNAQLERENAALREELAAWKARENDYRKSEAFAERLVRLRRVVPLPRNGAIQTARLLLVLLDRPGQIVGRERLLSLVAADPENPPEAKLLDTLVCYARGAQADVAFPDAIEMVWGEGYRIKAAVARELRRRLGEAQPEAAPCNGDQT